MKTSHSNINSIPLPDIELRSSQVIIMAQQKYAFHFSRDRLSRFNSHIVTLDPYLPCRIGPVPAISKLSLVGVNKRGYLGGV